MKFQTRTILAIFLAGMWVNASEFFRNQILLNANWVEHFRSLGMEFPSAPINAAMWVLWGFV
jgi:hypothetical protein